MATGESVSFKWIVGFLSAILTTMLVIAGNAHNTDHSDIKQDIKIIQQDVKSILRELK